MPTIFWLAEWLERKGMTQSELARRSGVSFQTVNRMCQNKTEGAVLSTLDRLATVLGVEPGELIVREKKGRR